MNIGKLVCNTGRISEDTVRNLDDTEREELSEKKGATETLRNTCRDQFVQEFTFWVMTKDKKKLRRMNLVLAVS